MSRALPFSGYQLTSAGGVALQAVWPAAITSVSGRVAEAPLASTTCTVKLKVPLVLGTPLRAPLGDKFIPEGRGELGSTLQAKGDVPPVTVNCTGP
jgi:hypothetical protein